MPWLAIVSEIILIAAAIALAWQPLRARGGAGVALAIGSAIIGAAALLGMLHYAGLDSVKSAHAGAVKIGNIAGMPLIFIGLMLIRMPSRWQWYGLGITGVILLSCLLTAWYSATSTLVLAIGLVGTTFHAWQANNAARLSLVFMVGGLLLVAVTQQLQGAAMSWSESVFHFALAALLIVLQRLAVALTKDDADDFRD